MFPVSVTGSITVDELGPREVSAVVARLRSRLEAAQLRDVVRTTDSVSFRGSWVREQMAWRRSSLRLVDSGSVSVHAGPPGRIEYECSTITLFGTITALAVGMGVLAGIASGDIRWPLPFIPFMWLWVFGLNYVFVAAAMRSLVRNAATQADDSSEPGPSQVEPGSDFTWD